MRRAKGALLAAAMGATLLAAGGCRDHDHGGHDHDHGPAAVSAGEHEQGHGHGHGEDAIGITAFSDQLELFAEHPPAIGGRELGFLAHLTVLDGFGALADATVTLVLEGPERREVVAADKPRAGIYRVTLTAPRPGNYRGKLVVKGSGIEDEVGGFEIVVHASEEAAAAAREPEQRAGSEPISFLKEQQWQVSFATAFAVSGTLVPSLEVAGEVAAPPGAQAEIGAAIAGRLIAPADGLLAPGSSVKRGQVLATIAPAPAAPEDAARADLAVVEAQARVAAAQAALERAERLLADRAVAQREVDDARRERAVADEALKTARRARSVFTNAASGVGAGLYRVSTPIAGIVAEVHATAGKAVSTGDPLFRVIDMKELWISARVPEQDAVKLRADQDASFLLPGLDRWQSLDVTGDDPVAKVVTVGRVVDPRSRTVEIIYALLEPDPQLRVGATVRVGVPVGDPWSGVVVPRGAVLEADGRAVVYVQVEGEAFEERVVRVAVRAGEHVGIADGVKPGERVVTVGANLIRLSARAATGAGHGHVH